MLNPEVLGLLAGLWEPEAEAMLDRIGVAPGQTCVFLGCGAAGILRPLSARVGPRGRLVGPDAWARVERDLVREQRGDPVEGLDFWMGEGLDLAASAVLVRATPPPPGPPRPVAILTAGRLALPPDWPAEAVEALHRVRAALVADLLRRLPGSTHTVAAESGHFVQLDQPELVVVAESSPSSPGSRPER